MDTIEAAETILRCFNFIQQSFKDNAERQSELDKQLCDLDHMLEWSRIDVQRGYRLAKQRQDVLLERRRVKDEGEMLRILHDQVINAGTGKAFVVALTAHLGGAKKRKAQLDSRVYAPRSELFRAGETAEVIPLTPCAEATAMN